MFIHTSLVKLINVQYTDTVLERGRIRTARAWHDGVVRQVWCDRRESSTCPLVVWKESLLC